MPGQRRRPVPSQLRAASFTSEEVLKGPGPDPLRGIFGGYTFNVVAIGLVHPPGMFLPQCAVVLTSGTGVEQLVGQGLPAGLLRSLGYPGRQFDDIAAALPPAAAQTIDRAAVDLYMGLDLFRDGDPQFSGLFRHLPHQPVAIVHVNASPFCMSNRPIPLYKYVQALKIVILPEIFLDIFPFI